MINEIFAGLTALGAVATAVAVWIGLRQLKAAERELELTQRQAQTSFEDDLSREYRQIVGELPAKAFYTDGGVELDDGLRRTFYRYFDLSNEQLFLARLGRVSAATAEQWRDGIRGNLGLPSFAAAWDDLVCHLREDFFEDLRPFASDVRRLAAADEAREREVGPSAGATEGARDAVASLSAPTSRQ